MNYIKLIRPINLLMIILTMYLFRLCFITATPYKVFFVEPVLSNIEFFLLTVATVFIAAGGYVINDIFDSDIDLINKKDKTIIGNEISEDEAYNFYKVLCLVGIICTIVLAFLTKNFRLSLFPVLIMVILNFYAHTFKKQLIVGNFIVSLCTAFVILLIALFESGGESMVNTNEAIIRGGIFAAAIVYGSFAFFTTFLREIIKDMEDIIGDEQYDCKTIPIVFGIKKTKIISIFIGILLLLFLGSIAFFLPQLKMKTAALVLVFAIMVPLVSLCIFIGIAKSKKQFHMLSNATKMIMLLGVLTMLYFMNGMGPYVFVQYVNFLKKLF